MKLNEFFKSWFGVALIAIILILSTIIIGYKVINQYEKERDEAAIKTISEILNQKSKANPLLPDILVINVSENDKKTISDSIKKEVSKYLIKRYTKKSDKDSLIEIRPYVSFLEKNKNKPITGEQVEELKKHIEFLVKTCDSAVEDSKRNIDTEISKINTWVSIWIGVFGLLGIFLPIVVNFKSFDSIKDIEKKANDAITKINDHKEDIEAIAGIKNDVTIAKQDIALINTSLPNLTSQAQTAIENSTQAISLSQTNQMMLLALDSISKLGKLENIVIYGGENRIQLIHSLLSSILRSFKTITDNHSEDFYRNLISEFCDRLTELARATIVRNRMNTTSISNFAIFLNSKLTSDNPISKTDHNEIISSFEIMLDEINPES
jgi:RNase H-fold protein (predicted Holliday junction resolvase)